MGPGWWLLWSALESIGFMMLLLRNNPSLLSIIIPIQDPILILGTLFIYIGFLKFFNKPVNFKVIFMFFASFVILHLSFYLITDSIIVRTVLFDLCISLIAFSTAAAIFKNKSHSLRTTAYFNILLFVIHGSIFAFRVVMIPLGAPFKEISSVSLFNIVQYFDALIIALLWTFGFIMMLNQKLNSEISEVKNQFEQIFHLSPDPVFIIRMSDEKLVDCNEGFINLYGYKKGDVLGKTSNEIQLWKDDAERSNFFKSLREIGQFENYEVIFQKKDTEPIHVLVSANILTLKDIPHVIVVTRNITERKRTEEEIRMKNEELLRLNSEKEKFFSIIAHDLKSPFQGLIGSSEILSNEYHALSEKEKISFINGIKKQSQNSYKLLENLLEWTRIQTGTMVFNPEYFNLLVELHPTITLFKQSAQNKNIQFNYDIDNLLFVNADKNMLSTIVRNLLSNAIKFTGGNGSINLIARKLDDTVEISVSDTGIGMEKESLDKLFSIGTGNSRRGTANEEGTGLGLLLCKEMIEKHRGKINVTSYVNKGTTFSFAIPSQ